MDSEELDNPWADTRAPSSSPDQELQQLSVPRPTPTAGTEPLPVRMPPGLLGGAAVPPDADAAAAEPAAAEPAVAEAEPAVAEAEPAAAEAEPAVADTEPYAPEAEPAVAGAEVGVDSESAPEVFVAQPVPSLVPPPLAAPRHRLSALVEMRYQNSAEGGPTEPTRQDWEYLSGEVSQGEVIESQGEVFEVSQGEVSDVSQGEVAPEESTEGWEARSRDLPPGVAESADPVYEEVAGVVIVGTPVASDPDHDFWSDATDRAAERARRVGTPDAWREVATAARVMLEMAETMEVVAEAELRAEQVSRLADDAEHAARAASEDSAQAEMFAEQKARAALEAEERARVAAEEAVAARRRAELASMGAPEAERAARDAQEASDEAQQVAHDLRAAVERACETNSPDSWTEARHVAFAAWATATGEDRSSEDRPTEDPGGPATGVFL